MAGRRCSQCDKRLKPAEVGVLCSPCYFELICNPGQPRSIVPQDAHAPDLDDLRWVQVTPDA